MVRLSNSMDVLRITFVSCMTVLSLLLVAPQYTSALHVSRRPLSHRVISNDRHSCITSKSQCILLTCRNNQQCRLLSSSRLFSSPLEESPAGSVNNNTNNSDGKKENDKSPNKQPIHQRIKRAILSIIKLFLTFPAKFKLYYQKLTKKGKIILGVQLLALGLVMGFGIQSTTNAQYKASTRPVEVGYSTFLDLVDVNGKGHTPGKNPALKLSNVIISKDRVGFKVVTDTEKHAKALLDKKLVQSNDVAVRPIPLSQKSIYAIKPIANQDLIDTLREHDVPFRAASMKRSNSLATIARFSIFAVYLLFLRKMYQTMNGQGGNSSTGPGKLATFAPGEPLVKFDDIEGIDGAKFEVMELVDTLRNPQKYEILGARAPTGLLLEGPPGTGKWCFVECVYYFFSLLDKNDDNSKQTTHIPAIIKAKPCWHVQQRQPQVCLSSTALVLTLLKCSLEEEPHVFAILSPVLLSYPRVLYSLMNSMLSVKVVIWVDSVQAYVVMMRLSRH